MATTPMIPPPPAAVNPNVDGAVLATPSIPGTDMTGICFRDQLWLNTYPLDRNLVFDYFALSPFYDYSCNNEQLRHRAIHPLDISHLSYSLLFTNLALFCQGRALYHISKAFNAAASKLEKIGYVEAENETASCESKTAKETIDFKELKRVDHILASLQRKLPPAPPPPPFPEGYAHPSVEGEKSSDNQQLEQLASVDPIIDQGPSKRMKF